jgi:hypothetical protein
MVRLFRQIKTIYNKLKLLKIMKVIKEKDSIVNI